LIESNDYRISLDAYSGPLDLLLFLIRRDEVDIYDIPIARVTGQYLEYVELLKVIDPDAIGEFLVLAATLMEIKSRMLLPKPPPEEVEEEFVDPRLELVHQLLEYKKYKDAARTLEDAAQVRSEKHARQPVLPARDPNELELEHLDIWDLFEAFNQLLKQIGKAGASYKIDIDDTPISLHAEDVLDSLERAGGEQRFEEVFTGRTIGEMIGLFLALLELIRQRRVRATQDRPFGPISLVLLDRTPLDEIPDDERETDRAETRTAAEDESSWTGALAESEADPLTSDDDLGEEFRVPDLPGLDEVTIIEAELDRNDVLPPLGRQTNMAESVTPDPKETDSQPAGLEDHKAHPDDDRALPEGVVLIRPGKPNEPQEQHDETK
jgi:segregation and condensation protein A